MNRIFFKCLLSLFLIFPVHAYNVLDDTTPFGFNDIDYGVKPKSLITTLSVGGYYNSLEQDLPQRINYFQDIWRYSLGLGYQVDDIFGFELIGGFASTVDQSLRLFSYDAALMLVLDLPLSSRLGLYGTVGPGFVSVDRVNVNQFTRFAAEYALGLKLFAFKNLNLRLDLRGITTFDTLNTAFAPSLGLQYYFNTHRKNPDMDGDGIANDVDKCPKEPELVNGYMDEDGCPEDPNDWDGDGIANDLDKCPKQPETKNGVEDEDGCPESDADGDGIIDPQDQCPNDPELVNGYKDEDGCPEDPNDWDSDGIANDLDKCPKEPETINGIEDQDGCPDLIPGDKDQDGIRDDVDKCPEVKEVINGYKDDDGCPDHELDEFSGHVEGIHFNVGKSTILVDSYDKLNRGAELLLKYARLRFVIEGHTDSTGQKNMNMALSESRAESVRQYLIEKGVSGSRMTIEHFGPDRPIANNATTDGRALNRRIEFRLLNLEEIKALKQP